MVLVLRIGRVQDVDFILKKYFLPYVCLGTGWSIKKVRFTRISKGTILSKFSGNSETFFSVLYPHYLQLLVNYEDDQMYGY